MSDTRQFLDEMMPRIHKPRSGLSDERCNRLFMVRGFLLLACGRRT